MSSQLLKLLRSLTSPRLQLKLLLVLSSPGYWSSPGRVTEAPFGSKFPGCKYSSIDRLLKPGFHLIAPIVSKNLPAIGKIRMIGAIIRKSLDRLDRPKRAVTQVRGLNLSTFFWRETVSKWRQEIAEQTLLQYCVGSYTPKERKKVMKKAPTWTWP